MALSQAEANLIQRAHQYSLDQGGLNAPSTTMDWLTLMAQTKTVQRNVVTGWITAYQSAQQTIRNGVDAAATTEKNRLDAEITLCTTTIGDLP